ncbi:hypothetical protein XENTR_v10015435 [Xenopus tropicalis]|nr:hypothetical protein XENTR_v10015435 [Xenopus tropicalis]
MSVYWGESFSDRSCNRVGGTASYPAPPTPYVTGAGTRLPSAAAAVPGPAPYDRCLRPFSREAQLCELPARELASAP